MLRVPAKSQERIAIDSGFGTSDISSPVADGLGTGAPDAALGLGYSRRIDVVATAM